MPQDKTQGTYITQEDIDTALQTAQRTEDAPDIDEAGPLFLDEADIVDSDPEDPSEEADYFGLLSKNDIEALLHGDLGGGGREAQDEIDSLLQTRSAAPDAPGPLENANPSDAKNEAQEDVERLIRTAGGETGVPGDGDTAEKVEAEVSETGDAVSQDDIDRLLMEALDDDEAETVGESESSETSEVLSQGDLDQLLSGEPEDDGQNVEPDPSKAASIAPQPAPEIADTIGSIEPDVGSDSTDDAESLISQSDLDQLLGDSRPDDDVQPPSSEPKSQSEHISQDDINRLLKESLDEAEDLLDEVADIPEESEPQEPVILAADEEPMEPPSPDEKPQYVEKTKKKKIIGGWKRRILENRLVWGIAAGIVFFVVISAMIMSSDPTETAPQPTVMTFSLDQTGEVSRDAAMFPDTRIRLPGFVVLVPPNPDAVTYVAADLILDFSDAAIVNVIKENEAFVRDIIYGTISSELMTRDISAIDEISIELAIRKALGQIIAREAIGRIAFDRFQLV